MRLFQVAIAALTFLLMDQAMAQERIRISSSWEMSQPSWPTTPQHAR